MVDYPTREPAGTLVIDTPNTYLYLVLVAASVTLCIGVGREASLGGREKISRMSEWPDWHPPKKYRTPTLSCRDSWQAVKQPLGARALYLGNTLYRIHGTNQPSTIGSFVSSGCIRLRTRTSRTFTVALQWAPRWSFLREEGRRLTQEMSGSRAQSDPGTSV